MIREYKLRIVVAGEQRSRLYESNIPVTDGRRQSTEVACSSRERRHGTRLARAAVLGGQASAIHLSGWRFDEIALEKKAPAMVPELAEIENTKFDFATFTRKRKTFSAKPSRNEKQVNELGDWVRGAPALCAALEKDRLRKYERDVKLERLCR